MARSRAGASNPSGSFNTCRSVGSATQPCPFGWIGLKMEDEEGQPVGGLRYQLELSDGSVVEGALDDEGKARVTGIRRGICRITFPDLDEAAWERK